MKKLEEFIIKNIWVIIIAVLFGGLPGVVFAFCVGQSTVCQY